MKKHKYSDKDTRVHATCMSARAKAPTTTNTFIINGQTHKNLEAHPSNSPNRQTVFPGTRSPHLRDDRSYGCRTSLHTFAESPARQSCKGGLTHQALQHWRCTYKWKCKGQCYLRPRTPHIIRHDRKATTAAAEREIFCLPKGGGGKVSRPGAVLFACRPSR